MSVCFRSSESCSSFVVERVKPENYPNLQEISLLWQSVAYQKERLAQTAEERVQFVGCDQILESIIQVLDPENSHSNEVYLSRDEKKNPQAILVIQDKEKSFLDIESLVANPINIRSQLNQNRLSGSGSFLLSVAEQIAQDRCKQAIRLTPLNGSVGFYQRHGYVADSVSGMPEGLFDMIKNLTVDASRSL